MNKCNNGRRKPRLVTYQLVFKGDPNNPSLVPPEILTSNLSDEAKRIYMALLQFADPETGLVTIDMGEDE